MFLEVPQLRVTKESSFVLGIRLSNPDAVSHTIRSVQEEYDHLLDGSNKVLIIVYPSIRSIVAVQVEAHLF